MFAGENVYTIYALVPKAKTFLCECLKKALVTTSIYIHKCIIHLHRTLPSLWQCQPFKNSRRNDLGLLKKSLLHRGKKIEIRWTVLDQQTKET
jgi:hypothetical protein